MRANSREGHWGWVSVGGLLLALCAAAASGAGHAQESDSSGKLRAVLVAPEMVTPEALADWKSAQPHSYNGVVLQLDDQPRRGAPAIGEQGKARRAAEEIRAAGLSLHYWIEIGRCPALADAHPLWMASLQGHDEWRRHHKDLRQPGADEVVKNYPWVPILYREAFDAHLARVRSLLAELPTAEVVFLNDLQGPPSACGCGNILCRWTADYGPIKTATPLQDDAPARFVAAVKALLKESGRQSSVVPVWTTECEEHDGAKNGACAGVDCFAGICWKAYTRQLDVLTREAPHIGALLAYREFQRDLPIYGEPAGWTRVAIESFARMPPRHKGRAIPAERIVAVVQGWDVGPAEVKAQTGLCDKLGTAGCVVALIKIEQSWQPKVVKYK